MKYLKLLGLISLLLVCLMACEKHADPCMAYTKEGRTVAFSLYTTANFSAENKRIIFRLFVENSEHELLWDSAFAPMAIRNIPDSLHKIVAEATIMKNENKILKAGFHYAIEDVGRSSYFDTLGVTTHFKVIKFDFR